MASPLVLLRYMPGGGHIVSNFLKNPYWSFIGVVLTILSILFPYSKEGLPLSLYTDWLLESLKWSLISGTFIFAVYAYVRSVNNDAVKILKIMATGQEKKDSLTWGIDSHISAGEIPSQCTWQEWIDSLIKSRKVPALEPHNFGKHYFLYDIFSGKRVEFPREKSIRNQKVYDTLPRGKVFMVVPRDV